MLRDLNVSIRNLRDMHSRYHMLIKSRNMNGWNVHRRDVHRGDVHGRNMDGRNVELRNCNILVHREHSINMANWSSNEALCIVCKLPLLTVVVAASSNDQNNCNRYNSFHIFSLIIFDNIALIL